MDKFNEDIVKQHIGNIFDYEGNFRKADETRLIDDETFMRNTINILQWNIIYWNLRKCNDGYGGVAILIPQKMNNKELEVNINCNVNIENCAADISGIIFFSLQTF